MEWSSSDSKGLARHVFNCLNSGLADAMAYVFVDQGGRCTDSYLANQQASGSMSEQVLRNLEADYEQKRINGYWPILLFTFNIGEDYRYDAGGRMLFERREHGFSMICETVAWSDLTFSESDLDGLRAEAEKYHAEHSCDYAKQLVAIRSITGLMERRGGKAIYNKTTERR